MEEKTCEIEATVPTGFELTAREEAVDKLGVIVKSDRGKIAFEIPIQEVKKIKDLQSVDNLYVVLKRYPKFQFSNNLADALSSTIDLVEELDWAHGINVWRQFISCHVTVSAEPVSDWKARLQKARERTQQTYGDAKCTGDSAQNVTAGSEPVESRASKNNSSEIDQTKSNIETVKDTKEVNENGKREKDKSVTGTMPKRARLEHNPAMPSFRATCYRTGKGHVFQSPQAASVFGGAIQDYFQWNVKMKDFDIEAVLTIEESDVIVSLGLTKASMHRRHLTKFGPTTLRPTIAYGMLRYCKIGNGDVVCDPMCGGGSIPIEAALNWPSAEHICGDFDERAVTRTQANIGAINDTRKELGLDPISVGVARWDTTELPLKDSSVDIFVSDMPFGKRSGSKMRNWHLYPKTLTDLARVSKLGTGRACLLTQDRKCMLKSLTSVKSYWSLFNTVSINIGGLSAAVYILHRTQELFKCVTKGESQTTVKKADSSCTQDHAQTDQSVTGDS